MEILKTTGIALSSRDCGEADLICDYYTKEYGKRRFIFKGLKKSRKRPRSAAEPGAIARLVYYCKRERDVHIVNEFSVEKFYPTISDDLGKITHLCYMLETVDKTSGYDMPDEQTYSLLSSGIDALSRTDCAPHLASFFVLRLLKIQGIISDMDECRMCGSASFSAFATSLSDFRPVCGACMSLTAAQGIPTGAVMSAGARSFIRECLTRKFGSIDITRYGEDDVLDILFSASLFVECYFHTELKTKSFILSDRFRNGTPVAR